MGSNNKLLTVQTGYLVLIISSTLLIVFFNNGWLFNDTVMKADSINERDKAINSSRVKSEWEELLKCQNIRLKRLQDRCKELGLLPDEPLHDWNETDLQYIGGKYLVDDKHHVILRALPKTGCTSWKSLVLNNTKHYISWIDKPPNPHNWGGLRDLLGLYTLNYYNKPAILTRLSSYFTILTVRHPLARLESGFRDKALNTGKTKEIINKNRTQFFNEAVYDLFQKRADIWGNGYHPNPHFKGYYSASKPCTIPISFIAKTETAKEDMRYVLKEKLSNIGSPVQKNPSKKLTDEKTRTNHVYLELFSGLKDPKSTVEAVVKEYKKDMYLFGYDYKITKEGVYATCESYAFNGMCC